jgi:SHS family lactate transporter-like MFS transporter
MTLPRTPALETSPGWGGPDVGVPKARRDRRRAFGAAFFGWMLDGYDFTILTLVLLEIQRDLVIDNAAVGALGTATLLARPVGGLAAGAAADRWGRKLPLMISIMWFSGFAFLSGFSTSYSMLFFLRTMFGLGMGGEWAAGMPLVLEHWPARLRGLVSGALQGAFSWGFILAAAVFHYGYPRFSPESSLGWRAMLWSGILPALLVLWIRSGVPESPLWLASRTQSPKVSRRSERGWKSVWRPQTLRTTLVLGALMFAYQSMSFWYATLLRLDGRVPLPYLVALNVGGILGAVLWGTLADTRIGSRGTISLASTASVVALPLFLYSSSSLGYWSGALLIGATAAGVIGIAPAYVASQFPTAFRGAGSGLAYHTAAAIGAIAPYALGALQDASWSLRSAMAMSIAVAGGSAVALVWTGPERQEA